MTTPPTTRWMCPLHCQELLESWKLQNSTLSARIKVHDLIPETVDEAIIKIKFIEKASKHNSMFGTKVPIIGKPLSGAAIPSYIEDPYDKLHSQSDNGQLDRAFPPAEEVAEEINSEASTKRNVGTNCSPEMCCPDSDIINQAADRVEPTSDPVDAFELDGVSYLIRNGDLLKLVEPVPEDGSTEPSSESVKHIICASKYSSMEHDVHLFGAENALKLAWSRGGVYPVSKF